MKKVLLGLFFTALFCAKGFSQHHLKSYTRADIGLGLTSQGWFMDANVSHLLSDKTYIIGGLLYENWEDNKVGANSYYLNGGLYHLMFKVSDIMYVNGGLGVSAVIDNVESISESESSNSSFNFGGYLGIELETYFANNMSFLVTARQGFYGNKTNFGDSLPMVFYAGVGVRLNLSSLKN